MSTHTLTCTLNSFSFPQEKNRKLIFTWASLESWNLNEAVTDRLFAVNMSCGHGKVCHFQEQNDHLSPCTRPPCFTTGEQQYC